MKLLTKSQTIVNPMLDQSFKNEVIVPIGERRKKADTVRAQGEETIVNITSELVSRWLPEALKRFGCCRCSICMAEASVTAFERLPVITAVIKNRKDLEKADKLREQYRRKILMTIIRIAVERKRMPHHM